MKSEIRAAFGLTETGEVENAQDRGYGFMINSN